MRNAVKFGFVQGLGSILIFLGEAVTASMTAYFAYFITNNLEGLGLVKINSIYNPIIPIIVHILNFFDFYSSLHILHTK